MVSKAEGNLYAIYKQLMIRFVKVLIQIIGDKRYRGMLAEFIKKKYVPIEESINLIQEFMGPSEEVEGGSPKKKRPTIKPYKQRELNESLAILSKR